MVGSLLPAASLRCTLLGLALALACPPALADSPCAGGADCPPAALTSELYGFITTNRTLTFASPGPIYDVLGDLVVNPGVTLTVQPGVTLRFAANHDTLTGGDFPGLAELRVRGTLVCDASVGDSIYFKSSGPGSGEWGQIKVESTGSATLRKSSISGAYSGIVLNGPGTLANVSIQASQLGVGA